MARAEFAKLSPEEQAEYHDRSDASRGQARDNRRRACSQLLGAEPQPIEDDQQPPQEPEDTVLALAPAQQQQQQQQEHVNIADEWIAGYGAPADDQAIVPVPKANLPPRVNEASPMHQDFVEHYLLPRADAAAAGGVPALMAKDPLCTGGAKQGSARFDERSSVLAPVSSLPVEEALPNNVQYPKRCGSLCSRVHFPGILSMQKSLQQVWRTVAKHRSLEWKAANVASADIVLVHEVHFSDIADPITVFAAIVEECGRHAGEPEVYTLAKYEVVNVGAPMAEDYAGVQLKVSREDHVESQRQLVGCLKQGQDGIMVMRTYEELSAELVAHGMPPVVSERVIVRQLSWKLDRENHVGYDHLIVTGTKTDCLILEVKYMTVNDLG